MGMQMANGGGNGEAAGGVPPLPLFAICAETPAIILNSTLYYLADREGAGNATGPSPGYFCFETRQYALAPSQSLAEIETQYLELQRQALEAYQAHYLRQEVDRRLETLRELEGQLAGYQLLSFLVQELVPRLKRLENRAAAKVEPVLAQSPGSFPHLRRALPRPGDRASLLVELLGQDVMALDDMIYPLGPVAPRRGQDLLIVLPDRVLGLHAPGRLLRDVAAAFRQRLCQMLQEEALLAMPAYQQRLQAVQTLQAHLGYYLPQCAGGSYLYQGQEWGILRQGNGWGVYLEVPAYVVEDADGSLYRFDATRVGLLLTASELAGALSQSRVQVLTSYEHMFVPSSGKSVCMPKGEAYFAALRRQPLADAVCTYLHDARYTLMAGHHAGNAHSPHRRIDSFTHRRISRQAAVQQKLPIFPYNRGLSLST